MNTIIALQGLANSGKTSTLVMVYTLLKDQYAHEEENLNTRRRRDLFLILKINDKKIGIECQGDPDSKLKENLEKLVKEDCDIILTACRTRGETFDTIKFYEETHHLNFIKQEKLEENYNPKNVKNSKIVFNEIVSLLEN